MSHCCESTLPLIHPTTSRITAANRWDHFLARWGVNREGHRIEPGLYALIGRKEIACGGSVTACCGNATACCGPVGTDDGGDRDGAGSCSWIGK